LSGIGGNVCYANCKYEYGMGECVGECKIRNKNEIPNDALCVMSDALYAIKFSKIQNCPWNSLTDVMEFLNKPKKKGRFRILELT
jgi:hypothetical protein